MIMTKRQERKERELRNAMALARVADVSIHEGFGYMSQFRSWEKSLQRLAEQSCNGYPKEVTEVRDGKTYRYGVEDSTLKARCEKREEMLTKKVIELAKTLNIQVDFQGDPRGLMFRLFGPNHQEISYYEVA